MTASVTTTKLVNLGQLATEMGGAALSCATDATGSTITSETVDQATLSAAVAAHVAVDEDGNRKTLEQRATAALATNATYLGKTSPTAAQTTAQVQLLTRECSAVIRLLLHRFDATD